MADFQTFTCSFCQNGVIKNYAATTPLVRGDGKQYYYFKCELCGHLFYEEVPEP